MKVTVTPFPHQLEDGTDDGGHHQDLVVHFVPCVNIRGHDDVPITDLTVEDVAQMSPDERENYHDLMTHYVLSDHCPGGQAMVCWGAGEGEEEVVVEHEGEELERLTIQAHNTNIDKSLITAAEAVNQELDEAMDVGDHVAGCPGEGHEDGHCLLLGGLSPPPPPSRAPPPPPTPPSPPPLVVDLSSARVQENAQLYREFFTALDQLDI